MTVELLSVSNLFKRFGGVVATDDLRLDVCRNEIHALIGPNGAGKTTVLSQIAGELRQDSGEIAFEGRDLADVDAARRVHLGIARTFQIPRLLKDETVLENVAIAVQATQRRDYSMFDNARADPSRLQPAMRILERLELRHRAHVLAADLSHGEQKLLELGIALAVKPKLLLLDEPMAGLGVGESAKLTTFLRTLKSEFGILLVEHDMDAVFSLADRITVLVYGKAIVTGTPEQIRDHPEVVRAYLGEDVE